MAFGIVLDLIIIAIIAVCVFFSARHGFVRTLIEVIGFIAAFVIAFTISSPLSTVTYDKIIGPKIVSNVEQITSDGGDSVAHKIWDSFPDIVKNNSSRLGISEQAFYDKVNSAVSGSTADSAARISSNVTKPLIVKLLGAFYSSVISVILIIVSKYLAKIVNKLFKVSVIGKINAVLGGAVGALKGIVFALIFCIAVSVLMLVTKNGFWFFTTENIEASNLFKFLYGFSPFV